MTNRDWMNNWARIMKKRDKVLLDDEKFKVMHNSSPGYYRFIYKGALFEVSMVGNWQDHTGHARSVYGFTEEEVRAIILFYKKEEGKTLSLETEMWLINGKK